MRGVVVAERLACGECGGAGYVWAGVDDDGESIDGECSACKGVGLDPGKTMRALGVFDQYQAGADVAAARARAEHVSAQNVRLRRGLRGVLDLIGETAGHPVQSWQVSFSGRFDPKTGKLKLGESGPVFPQLVELRAMAVEGLAETLTDKRAAELVADAKKGGKR